MLETVFFQVHELLVFVLFHFNCYCVILIKDEFYNICIYKLKLFTYHVNIYMFCIVLVCFSLII